jgi:hypothetical protein
MSSLRATVRTVVEASTSTGPRLPGWFGQTRMLCIVALAVGLIARRPDEAVAWVPVAVMLVCTAGESVARRLIPRPRAVHLPGYADPTSSLVGWVAPTALLALAMLAVTTLAAWPPEVVVVSAALQALVLLAAGLQLIGAYRAQPLRAAAARAALVAYAPEFVLYTARRGGAYQLDMWVPHLQALGRRFVVVTRDPEALTSLGHTEGIPVIACPTWRDLDDAVVPSLRAAFYVNSVAANADFVTYRHMTHVYLGHGESDKALSHHPAHAMYDQVFVSGAAAVDRYARHGVQIPPERLVVIGSPQAATVQKAARPVREIATPTILYAPTWQGYNDDSSYSSLPHGVALVTALLDRPGAVIFRPHPFSRTRVEEAPLVKNIEQLLVEDARNTGRAHVWGVDEPFAATANRSDVMVADLSSVVTEYLASDKPLAIVDDGDAQTFIERNPVAQAAYVVASDLGNLEAVLADLVGADPLRETRHAVLARYVGAAGDSAFQRAVLAILDAPTRSPGE